MAEISRLSRLFSGVQRQVDLSTNTLVVGDIKVGGSGGTLLTQTILNNLLALQNGTDFATGTNAHTHDGRYFTETELGSSSASSGSDLIGDDSTYSNFTPAAATVKGALSGIDTALATGSGRVKISAADTTSDYLNASITAGAGLSKSITNPGADEVLDLAVNVDNSTIEINTDALRVKDLGITAAKLAADSVTTAKILDANVTAAKLAADSVTTVKILDANVTNAKIATGVDAAKIADGSVSNAEFQYLDGVTSSIQTQLNAKVAKAGSAMDSAANITFSGGGEILGLPSTPSAAGAAASKAYVDAVALGLSPKKAVRVATLVSGTLASAFANGSVIDGVTLVTGDRILIKDQASPAQNGIYTVNASGAPTRATDFDSVSPIDEINGAWVPVQAGTQIGKVFVQYGVVAVIGTDPINFDFYNPIASLIGGDMISVSGSTISVDLATVSGLSSTNAGDAAGQLRVKLEASNPSLQIDGSNQLGAKLDASGAITSGSAGLKANTDGSTLEIATNALQIKDLGVSTAKLAAASVTEAKLAASVAGAGLSGGAGSPLAVNVDDSTIEINADTLRVKDLGITAAKLAADSVTTAKILDANVTAAKLAADSVTTVKILDANVTAAKLAADSVTTVKILDANVTLAKLAADSVDENKIVSTAHDASMTGGSGAKLAVASSPRGLKSMVAGEAMAANTSFLVRFAVTGETAGRVYKADQDATTTDKFYAIGICLKTSAVAASDAVDMTFEGTHTLGSSDSAFAAGDVGKAVYLTAAGAFSTTAPTTTNYASYRIGVVEDTNKIWVGSIQLNGIN